MDAALLSDAGIDTVVIGPSGAARTRSRNGSTRLGGSTDGHSHRGGDGFAVRLARAHAAISPGRLFVAERPGRHAPQIHPYRVISASVIPRNTFHGMNPSS